MSEYSPQAETLLKLWSCMSLNMRSVILRARWLQQTAEQTGREDALEQQLRSRRVDAMYRQVGREMRAFSAADGVEKQFPEDSEVGPMGVGRFIDFRISEDAIPELCVRLDSVDQLVQRLLITLLTIRL